MNKKSFIQQASITLMLHPYATQKPHTERVDAAIGMAEALWERLKVRGYGPSVQGEPKETRKWYSELQDQERFDRSWAKYGREGSRDQAARRWIGLEEAEKAHVEYSIPKYLEQLHGSGKAKAHFSTWLSERRWESFDMKEDKPIIQKVDEKAQDQAHFKRMLEIMPEGPAKERLREQIVRAGSDTKYN